MNYTKDQVQLLWGKMYDSSLFLFKLNLIPNTKHTKVTTITQMDTLL